MQRKVCTYLLLFYLVMICYGTADGDVQLQVCTQKDETEDDSIPLDHSPVKAISPLVTNPDDRMDVDLCVRANMIKISLTLDADFDGGDMTLCWSQSTWNKSTALICYRISGMKTAESNTSIICWFRQNVTEKNIVGFYISKGLVSDDNHFAFYSSVELKTKGLCSQSICDQVEPLYTNMVYCGNTYTLELNRTCRVLQIALTCVTCSAKVGGSNLRNISHQTVSNRTVSIHVGSNLHTGTYNLTIVLETEEHGRLTTCAYRKTIDIICEDGLAKIGSSKQAVTVAVSTENDDKNCETNPEQCSFSHFLLFGVTVSAAFILLLLLVTCIVVHRKEIVKCGLKCCRDSDSDVECPQQIPMIPNNESFRRSSVTLHLPRHVHFQRMDTNFMLLFLPVPYDMFTRDSMECLRKVISLDNRIPSACVYEPSVVSETIANKFDWMDNTLNDVRKIVIFLYFTSLHKQRDPTIVDEVLRMCQAPATRPGCHIILAHVTDNMADLDNVNFLGSSFNITTKTGYKSFLETVLSIYGYKKDFEHDRQKLEQIVNCGASKMFLNKLNTCPTSLT